MAIQKAARGNSRAAQNRHIRREALREELKAREYLRQLHQIAERLDPAGGSPFSEQQVGMAKARAEIYFRLLDKCLPSLRPVELPVELSSNGGRLMEVGARVVDALAGGRLSPSQAEGALRALAVQARLVEAEDLERRIAELERIADARPATTPSARS